MNNLDKQYLELLQDVLNNGVIKKDRTGTGTKSVFGRSIRHKMSDGFPLLTTKKMHWKSIIYELLWFLRGDTNIKYLVDNGCNIWTGDSYKAFCKERQKLHNSVVNQNPTIDFQSWEEDVSIEQYIDKIKNEPDFAEKWGDLGPIYGKQWRNWEFGEEKAIKNGEVYSNGEYKYDIRRNSVDQINDLINNIKSDPDSRRLIVNSWNVGSLPDMVLPPCHYSFQCYTRELTIEERWELWHKREKHLSEQRSTEDEELKRICDENNIPVRGISLIWNQRSVDTFLGLPFNIASYGLLLEILAKECNMVPDELIGNLGDTHLYVNHLDAATEQLKRDSYNLPTLDIKLHFQNVPSFRPEYWLADDFVINGYQSHPTIKAPLSN